MSFDVVSAVVPLAGVVVGGALSFATQMLTQRSNERLEARRQEAARVEARRVERIRVFERFLTSAQAAERATIDLVHHHMHDDETRRKADIAIDDLWLSEKLVRVVCSNEFWEAANKYSWRLDDAIDHGTDGAPVWDFLRETRVRFLDAARTEIDQLGGAPLSRPPASGR
jgi:hypothetical protein